MKVVRKVIEPIVHVAIWLTGYLLILYGANTMGVFNKVDGSIFYPITIGTIINVILFYSVAFYLIPRISSGRKPIYSITWIIVWFTALIAIKSIVGYFFFTAKFSTFDEPFESQLILNLVTGMVILSIALAYGFTKIWIRNERLKGKLKEEKLSAELSFLKAQINPHFLFNILNTAYSSATKSGDDKTADIIEKLSGLMRYMLHESNSDKVELEKEIEYISNYIELQKIRIAEETPFSLEFNVSEDLRKYVLAPLLLVPFIENAFKHGISLENKSFIEIDISVTDYLLNFLIINSNYSSINSRGKMYSGIGLQNVRKRLELIYPDLHQLKVTESKKTFKVELEINLR